MFLPSELMEAAEFINKDSLARQLFRELSRTSSESGWALAKAADADPKDVDERLRRLKSLSVLSAQGSGLEAYYYLTDLGFKLREFLLSRAV